MPKLVLRTRFTLGDVVLMTAAVRDLHQCWPGRFQIDVRTGFTDLWANSPHLVPLDEYEPGVQLLDCDMPLVERSDEAGKHALHGFIDFLSTRLAVKLNLTAFRGDIHLSAEEQQSASPIKQRTGLEIPYWIINAGGKYDCTIKWWDPARFQAVVDHFRGRIQFVQVGRVDHCHLPLRGVIDLRGRTKIRDLVRLVHHADGVVCGVTALMHLAAAVPRPSNAQGVRPCVVVAGGREPAHWESYPGHQFLHTVGALHCCATSGCWRSRTQSLGDGHDVADRNCVNVRGNLPACMDLITAADVIRRVELYLAAGHRPVLSVDEAARATEAISWSEKQAPVAVPLNFYNAPRAAADFIARIPPYPGGFAGRGIVICAGGTRMFANAWVCIQMLRHLGCRLPIELWHLGKAEMDSTMEELVRPFGVTCIDASAHTAVRPARIDSGWPLKPYAIINSAYEEVLLLDADNVPVRNPEFLFESTAFESHGAVLWPDEGRLPAEATAWRLFDVAYRDEPEVESGQVLVNKGSCWNALLLCLWYNEHSDLFYEHVHGDKETFPFAFRRLNTPYAMPPHAAKITDDVMYQHDFDGHVLFQHRNGDKWDLLGRNQSIPDFLYEDECRQFLRDLAQRWDGRLTWLKRTQAEAARAVIPARNGVLRLAVVLASCDEREEHRKNTLRRLAEVGWPTGDVLLMIDEGRLPTKVDRLTHTAWRGFREALETNADYVLYLEDDVDFNQHLLENLRRWGPMRRRELHIGGLCHFGFRELAWDPPGYAYLVHPNRVWGSQAVLLSRSMLRYCLEHWAEGPTNVDKRLCHLASQARQPFFFHCPSLVQHVGEKSTLGHNYRPAVDFDPTWQATNEAGFEWAPAQRSPQRPEAAAHG